MGDTTARRGPMKPDRTRLLYGLGLLALIATVAIARHDLFLLALETTLRQMRRGGTVRLKLLGEIVLFGGFLLLTLRVIPAGIRPARDLALFLAASVAGYAVEAWGTRTGLWSYYTGEAPPLWIVPGWPLGALIFDRVAPRAREAFSRRIPERWQVVGYWALAAAALLAFLRFSVPAMGHPGTWAVFAALAAAFVCGREPKRDFWLIVTGMVYVFFADFWGTTNNCWRYYIQDHRSFGSLITGVGFGMLFDTAVILASMRVAGRIAPGSARPHEDRKRPSASPDT
ncbi:MAG: hypothetical protein ABII00_02970 [Elusimicrobiota bacterium]